MPASCFLLIVISVSSLELRLHCTSVVGIFSMKVASALESCELSGLVGAFPSRAEVPGVSAGWAVLNPSETPSFQASCFPLGWSCTPGTLLLYSSLALKRQEQMDGCL